MQMIIRALVRQDLTLFMVTILAFMLAGCEMTSPSYVNHSPIRVSAENYSETMSSSAFTQETAKLLGKDFKMRGQGPVDVTVVYGIDGKDKKASNEARRIAALLEQQGVGPVVTSTLPINDKGYGYQLILNYKQVAAHPPADCGPLPADNRASIAGSEDGKFDGYRYGCGIDTYMAQQVARPRDLLGSDQIAPSDGSRYGNSLKDYRDGKAIKDLKGQAASETKL